MRERAAGGRADSEEGADERGGGVCGWTESGGAGITRYQLKKRVAQVTLQRDSFLDQTEPAL